MVKKKELEYNKPDSIFMKDSGRKIKSMDMGF